MISWIEVKGMRALRYVSMRLDPFMVMVGPNACGKSTLFDTLLFVRDVLHGGLEAAVFGQVRMNIEPRAASPQDLTWLRQGGGIEIALTLALPEEIISKLGGRYRYARYELGIHTDGKLSFDQETLWLCADLKPASMAAGEVQSRLDFPEPIQAPAHIITPAKSKSPHGWRKVVSKMVDSGNDYFRSETSDWNNLFRLGPLKSALANLPEDEHKFPAATWVKRVLMEGVHRLALNAEKMRMPSPAGSSSDFLPDGSNLPWVVHALEKTPELKARWIKHIATSLEDLKDIKTKVKEEDRSRYLEVHYHSGLEAPAWVLSDGTLRLLALTLLAYTPTSPAITLIEEPENGIHPKALETVMQSLGSVYRSQILCATHSPVVLSQLRASQVLCFGKTDEGAIDIVRGDEHPGLRAWHSALNLGELFATGVLG